jgi:phosphate/sulfate permease
MSGVLNFLGAIIVGTAVAVVITKIVPPGAATLHLVVAVLLGSLVWNVLTWWLELPAVAAALAAIAYWAIGLVA